MEGTGVGSQLEGFNDSPGFFVLFITCGDTIASFFLAAVNLIQHLKVLTAADFSFTWLLSNLF